MSEGRQCLTNQNKQNEKDLFIRADGNDAGGRRINTNIGRNKDMSTITLQIPNEQIGWFEQMVRTMGWTFHREKETASKDVRSDNVITPALRRKINKARKEDARGETIICRNKEELQQFFDSL